VLDLLQHRIGQPIGEGIAGQQQNRKAIGVGDAGRRDHVRCAGADRGRRHHELAPPLRLREADRRQRHRLLVLPAPGRERVLHRLERLGQTGHVAVPEYGEHAREERHPLPVDLGELIAQVAHEGLGHRQLNGGVSHGCFSSV
jgi:hypothetical protein